jgi:hypothetical protein
MFSIYFQIAERNFSVWPGKYRVSMLTHLPV